MILRSSVVVVCLAAVACAGGRARTTAGSGGAPAAGQGGSTGSGGGGTGGPAPPDGGGSTATGGMRVATGGTDAGAGGTTTSSSGGASTAAATGGAGGGLGPFTGLDAGPVSNGGTITFQNIGATGSYPSVCAPSDAGACCRQPLAISSDALTPWDEDLIMTLRGPMVVKQFAVYQPDSGPGAAWDLVSTWDARSPAAATGIAFTGSATPNTAFDGTVGSVCLVNASTDQPFGCGPGSSPYCAASSANHSWGWRGSKLFVFLASMPHVGAGDVTTAQGCAAASNGWTDAPWIGFSVGELVRAGAFSACQCYEVTPNHGDGCGQLNAFEVINDNDTSGNYKNLELFSSNFFGYGGDFGGPCGTNACDLTGLAAAADLVSGSAEAAQGGLASQTPRKSPTAFFRRPVSGYRYFIVLFDVDTRTVQMAMVHPQNIPPALSDLLPGLPAQVARAAIDDVLQLRLPR